ncbi:alpha/beta hydrolase [Zavarzinia sp.]|uniref:alpha/beta hydrolase n=1 Tax=Zavarzinia sp. TaxID=2027920 RepID=UPI0035654C1C
MRRVVLLVVLLVAVAAAVLFGVLPGMLMAQYRQAVPPAPADLAVQTVHFASADGVDLVAWVAEAEAPKATVILVHGSGGTRADDYIDQTGMMRDLLGRNYSVLALDLRNHGDSGAGPRGPSYGPDEARDVIAAVDWVKRRSPGRRVAVYGTSMGGAVAIYAAAADPRIEAVVVDSTYADSGPVVGQEVEDATGLPPLLTRLVLWGADHFWGLAERDGRTIDVIGRLGARPLLIIHAKDDPVVPFADAQRLAAADPAAVLWQAPPPVAEDGAESAVEGFGGHAQTYRQSRELWVEQVSGFLDGLFATMFG